MYHLKQCIAVGVNNVLWDSGEKQTSAEALMGLLKARYGQASHSDRYEMELRMLKRKKGDTALSLFTAVRRCSALAWPGEWTPQMMKTVINNYADALDRSDIRKELMIRKPKTLEEALSIATTMEFIDSSDQHRSGLSDEDGKRKDKTYARGAQAEASEIDDKDAEILALKKKLAEMEKKKATGYNQNDRGKKSGTGSISSNRGKGATKEPITCYGSKEVGHMKRDCLAVRKPVIPQPLIILHLKQELRVLGGVELTLRPMWKLILEERTICASWTPGVTTHCFQGRWYLMLCCNQHK